MDIIPEPQKFQVESDNETVLSPLKGTISLIPPFHVFNRSKLETEYAILGARNASMAEGR